MGAYMHFVQGPSAHGILNQYYRHHRDKTTSHDIYTYTDALSLGSLQHLDTADGLARRARYFRDMIGQPLDDDDLAWHHTLMAGLGCSDLLQCDFSTYDRLVIWYGNDVNEQLMLRMLCNTLQAYPLAGVAVEAAAGAQPYPPHALAECGEQALRLLTDTIRDITPAEQARYRQEWEHLTMADIRLRIYENEHVVEVAEDYYDAEILSYCTDEFRTAARVVGEVMGTHPQRPGDTWLLYRVRKLVEAGILISEGEGPHYMSMKIKKAGQL